MPRASLTSVPLEKLQSEIARRRKELPKLIARRDELNRRIAELESLAAPAPPAEKARKEAKPTRRAKRAPAKKGQPTLKEALAQVLAGKEGVSIAEITREVLARGYKTRSKNPYLLVKQTLYDSDQFERVGKGLYALKA